MEMKKIYRQIGFEGRTTIPQVIRDKMGLDDKDFISFSYDPETRSVIIRQEWICDGCDDDQYEDDCDDSSDFDGQKSEIDDSDAFEELDDEVDPTPELVASIFEVDPAIRKKLLTLMRFVLAKQENGRGVA